MYNLREAFKEIEAYSTFNREERNCVAILYHSLLLNGNLSRFLSGIGYSTDEATKSAEISVEFSFLRDLWHKHQRPEDLEIKKQVIIDHLAVSDRNALASMSAEAFNSFFGATPSASKLKIQSPATWSITRFESNLPNNDEFLRACKFKWAFRVKPDLVIQLCPDRAVCIEAKWDSREGSYPTASSEKHLFSKRQLTTVPQRELQKYMMENLLGIQTAFCYLVRKRRSGDPQIISWNEAFRSLDTSGFQDFITDWIKSLDQEESLH